MLHAAFRIGGPRLFCIDSPAPHAFPLTPALSLHAVCASDAEIDERFARMSAGGTVRMPPGEYPFARRYGWLQDRFGVSWQLGLEG